MAPSRAAAYLGGGILLLAWLASAAGISRHPRGLGPQRQPVDVAPLDTLASDVQSQAFRLRTRLAAAPAPHASLRNPFTFSSRESPVRPVARRDELTALATERAEVEPELVLVGVAEQNTAKGMVRTAIVAGPRDELFMVTEGQQIGGRYRVTVVSTDAVELQDLSTGTTRRLFLESAV